VFSFGDKLDVHLGTTFVVVVGLVVVVRHSLEYMVAFPLASLEYLVESLGISLVACFEQAYMVVGRQLLEEQGRIEVPLVEEQVQVASLVEFQLE